jgi:hypothetical protein
VDIQAIKPKQLSISWRSILVVILIALSLQSCGVHNKHGAGTPDRVVELYLTALEARNEASILQLMPEKSVATAFIKAKVVRFGGYKIEDRQINYTKPKPSLWNAKLQGLYIDRFGIKRKFEDSIVLEYQSKGELKLYAGRWYLLLD